MCNAQYFVRTAGICRHAQTRKLGSATCKVFGDRGTVERTERMAVDDFCGMLLSSSISMRIASEVYIQQRGEHVVVRVGGGYKSLQACQSLCVSEDITSFLVGLFAATMRNACSFSKPLSPSSRGIYGCPGPRHAVFAVMSCKLLEKLEGARSHGDTRQCSLPRVAWPSCSSLLAFEGLLWHFGVLNQDQRTG